MGALRAKRQAWRLERNDRLGQRRSWGLKGNVMRDRAGGRRATKGAGLKVGVGSAMVVRPGVFRGPGMMVMGCGHSRQPDGTQFQGERYAAGRHEAGGHIGAEQKQGQQPEAGRASTPMIERGLRHFCRPIAYSHAKNPPLPSQQEYPV